VEKREVEKGRWKRRATPQGSAVKATLFRESRVRERARFSQKSPIFTKKRKKPALHVHENRAAQNLKHSIATCGDATKHDEAGTPTYAP